MYSSDTVRLGMIGLGLRAETLAATIKDLGNEAVITAICDLDETRVKKFGEIVERHTSRHPAVFRDHKKMLEDPDIDAVLIATSWNSHLAIARDALQAGKYAGFEVGGASSLDELWQLIHAHESTGASCMMLENCCYGRNELMVLNMVRKGLFGELIHCECGYEHDIRHIAWSGRQKERALHNQHRNCDLYPTHGIGPIAKILRINRGNRFLSLTSTASKAKGFTLAAAEHGIDREFKAGDVVVTVIRCANGETITITHCISLPRPYSRNCRVQGTQGIWLENANGVYIDGISPLEEKLDVAGNPYTVHGWNDVSDFYEEYDHPIWRKFRDNIIGGHGGMDSLSLLAFLDAVRKRITPPIDIYDSAAWMSITCLSEQSIALGGAPVAFPDFTNGKWFDREPDVPTKWNLNNVYDL